MTPGPPPSGPADLDPEIDELYRLPLEAFVPARTALAARLRQAGRKDEAAHVKALGKPSVTAWAVNQAWWSSRPAFDAMLAAGRQLREVQQATLAGSAVNVREAAEARQRAIAAVVDVAIAALGGPDRVGPAMQQRIAATCDALSVGSVAEGTRPGHLVRDLQPAGLTALSSLLTLDPAGGRPSPGDATPPQAPPRRTATVTPFPRRPAEGTSGTPVDVGERSEDAGRARETAAAQARLATLRKVEALLADAERELADADEAARQTQAQVEAAEQALATVRDRIAGLERAFDDAQREESAARAALARARRESAAAETAQGRAVRLVEKARTDVDRHRG